MEITGLCVVKSEPPVWFCDVGGQCVELTTDDLQTPQRFQKACMEQIQRRAADDEDGRLAEVVSMLMDGMSEIDVPEELTYKGQFMDLLEAFCDGRVQAQSAEEIALGKPFTDDEEGLTYFKLEALLKYLRNQKFDSYSRGQIQERLKELNDNGTANGHKRFNTTKGDTKLPEGCGGFRCLTPGVQVPSIQLESEVPFNADHNLWATRHRQNN